MRLAMRQWVSGVTVVTSAHAGIQHGMTVSSFTSISLIPPMILVSMERSSRTHDLVLASGFFAITILDAGQQEISERFAGRTIADEDRCVGLATQTMLSGAPLIQGGLAFFDCRVVATQEAGGSTVFFAEVMAASSQPNGNPLAYNDRTYFTLQK